MRLGCMHEMNPKKGIKHLMHERMKIRVIEGSKAL